MNRYEIGLTRDKQWELMESFAALVKHVPISEVNKLEGLQTIADILLTSWKYVQPKTKTT